MRYDDFSLIWKALSDPTRRHILDLLRERARTTGELVQAFNVTRFAIMKHLSTLEQSGLITVHKRGRERWNTLNPVPLQLIYERWLSSYEAPWAHSLLQLKGFVEGDKAMGEMNRAFPMEAINVSLDVIINATPTQVFTALTKHLASWWGHPYLRGDALSIILEAVVGGRLYETWANGNDGALWATVSSLKQDKELCLIGSMGMPEPTYGVIKFQLEPRGNTTLVHLTHEAFGKINQETEASYSAGWQELLDVRLRAFVERNIRYGIDQGSSGWFPTAANIV